MKTRTDVGPSTSADFELPPTPCLTIVRGSTTSSNRSSSRERGLLQGQPFVIRHVRDGGSLVIADHRAERGHSTS